MDRDTLGAVHRTCMDADDVGAALHRFERNGFVHLEETLQCTALHVEHFYGDRRCGADVESSAEDCKVQALGCLVRGNRSALFIDNVQAYGNGFAVHLDCFGVRTFGGPAVYRTGNRYAVACVGEVDVADGG